MLGCSGGSRLPSAAPACAIRPWLPVATPGAVPMALPGPRGPALVPRRNSGAYRASSAGASRWDRGRVPGSVFLAGIENGVNDRKAAPRTGTPPHPSRRRRAAPRAPLPRLLPLPLAVCSSGPWTGGAVGKGRLPAAAAGCVRGAGRPGSARRPARGSTSTGAAGRASTGRPRRRRAA